MSTQTDISLTINGAERALSVEPWTTLLDAMRDQLGLTGAKRGCNQGVCGACTVLRDGRPVRGCLSLAIDCAGAEIATVEGLSDGNQLAAVQQAFLDASAVQCGFCTPGMLLVVQALLRENPRPSIDEIRCGLSGNLCRCSGYRKIVDAVAASVTSAP
ncbi:MAG: (2Fe-2S)-binding protein [Alphaproteobacteria bacterium]|nr:(2Fe-2S)-binding protein [Alphaproteobacteria bacterium]